MKSLWRLWFPTRPLSNLRRCTNNNFRRIKFYLMTPPPKEKQQSIYTHYMDGYGDVMHIKIQGLSSPRSPYPTPSASQQVPMPIEHPLTHYQVRRLISIQLGDNLQDSPYPTLRSPFIHFHYVIIKDVGSIAPNFGRAFVSTCENETPLSILQLAMVSMTKQPKLE